MTTILEDDNLKSFFEWKLYRIYIQISMKFVLGSPIDNGLAIELNRT